MAIEVVPLPEVGLGVALGICLLLRVPLGGGSLGSQRSWLQRAVLVIAALLTWTTTSRFGVPPPAAMFAVAGVVASLTHHRRISVACFVTVSLWLGPWWALLVFTLSPVVMAGVGVAGRFDRRLPVWLLGASAGGAALALPDVEAATLFAAAFATFALSTLGRRPRFGAIPDLVPFMMWAFAMSAQGRPPSIAGAVGGLGVLLVLPVLGLLAPAGWTPRGSWSWVVLQAGASAAMARHAGLLTTWERPLLVVAGGLAALVIALVGIEQLEGRRRNRANPEVIVGVRAAVGGPS